MRIKDVDLPLSLINAQRNESLVVFAGAGISMGSPSNLPGFKELATQVAGGALASESSDTIDRFLGRLKNQGINVHDRTRDILNDLNSKPTPVHNYLLKLFRSPSAVRIVTTNFDRHFSTVAEELFRGEQDKIDIYNAPALPLGRAFNGLVYLHGCIDKEPPERLVLTDRDFGQAYLTEGWATRFLQEMFNNYTVLFIGYSHNDPVMHYLARGLLPGTFRYALTEPGQEKDWKFLDITPVVYPLNDDPDDRHRALGEFIIAWANYTQRGALDHERCIREIVESNPPIDPEDEDADYIENAIKNLVTVRFFTRYARTVEWLRWAEAKQAFHVLFNPIEQAGAVDRELAFWYAKHFAFEYPVETLALVQRQGQRLNRVLWQAIAHKLTRNPLPDPGTIAKWVVVLLCSVQPDWQLYSLGSLLNKCRYPEDSVTAILLFEYLTKPRLKLKTNHVYPNEDGSQTKQVDAEVVIEVDGYLLNDSWKKVFRPNLKGFLKELEPILTKHLTQAHLFLRAFNKANDCWDPLSRWRSAIEPHEQDRFNREFDILINAARDTIEEMLRCEPDRAHNIIEIWSTSGIPLLKRLAIHGITESSYISADEKIAWVLRRDWLYAYGIKHEIFRLLANAYPSSTEQNRLNLLESVQSDSWGQDEKASQKETHKYEICNLLFWLHQVAPDCPLVTERFKAMQEAYPDFEPSKHPDFCGGTSSIRVDVKSPLTAEELLKIDLHENIDWILTYQGDAFHGRGIWEFLAEITKAVSQRFEWSWNLLIILEQKSKWNSHVWGSIFQGWQQGSFSENQWERILTFLINHMQLYDGFANYIINFLEAVILNEQDGLSLTCLRLAEGLADQIFDFYAKKPVEKKEESEDKNFLGGANSHTGEEIVKFWLHAFSQRRVKTEEKWTRLPIEYKKYFEKVLTGGSYTAQLGQVVLATQIRFLFDVDPDWTRENILPLLDWSLDERQAQQCWNGYLTHRQISEALLPELLPLYVKTFPQLSTKLPSMRTKFCRHLASIAINSSSNPIEEDDWLWKFLSENDLESHAKWAAEVGSLLLYSLDEETIKDLWGRWMADYWSKRTEGVPRPLSLGEKKEMVLWAIPLEPVFPAVVKKICAIQKLDIGDTLLYSKLKQKQVATKHPMPLSHLLHHLVSNAWLKPETDEPFFHCREVKELVQSLVGTAPQDELLLICEELARLGCSDASELKEVIEKNGTGLVR